jgi:8-oxo-dGTP pyrophosphatase MutT (NUDIX family)
VEQTWGPWDEGWQRSYFLRRFRPGRCQIIVVQGQDVGVVRLERGTEEWFLAVLEVLPAWQRRGIGTRVVQSVLAEAAECQKPIALQVLKVNPARHLYYRLGFRKVGETSTHVEMRARPPEVAGLGPTGEVEKVVAYITRDEQLLVFRHTEYAEAGIQVPAGTVECHETPAEAVLREAHEETGLSNLSIVRFLGISEHSLVTLDCSHRRHFFQLQTDEESPARWRHVEISPSDGSGPVEFELFWMPLSEPLPMLSGSLGEMLPLLVKRLGAAGSGEG